jgi:hypothetical protein
MCWLAFALQLAAQQLGGPQGNKTNVTCTFAASRHLYTTSGTIWDNTSLQFRRFTAAMIRKHNNP